MNKQSADSASAYFIHSHEEKVKQIALELHEHISQNLYSLFTGLEYLQTGMEDESFRDHAKEMSALMGRTIQDIRLLSRDLYPISLQALGLSAALKSYIRAYSVTFGVQVEVQSIGEAFDLPEQVSLALYRSCVEALLNTAKHAAVDSVVLRFTWVGNSLRIDITDKGKGFRVDAILDRDGFTGIAALKRRMEIIGGFCELNSIEGKGTTVSLFYYP